ncbi:unnamed protein product [Spirodela intermedia]|uniref:DNA polymerase epsilon catalytic subunit n=1 Tax=Spirodela intermedia TaxID=51605 RepID=A0A7I8ISH0_SPIIN|nr:unnamed protein product [Spirodela intermedia]CAA6660705.1 unnamed protein product [Spirodela intermedia]
MFATLGTPVSERAVPVAIFETDSEIVKFYLRKWCRISSDVGIRSIIDWSYYKQRLSSAIQKIITIPAAMQKVSNPVPRVIHPDWLHKKVRDKDDRFRQKKLHDMFGPIGNGGTMQNHASVDSNHELHEMIIGDMEDIMNKEHHSSTVGPRPTVRSYAANKENLLANASSPCSKTLDRQQQEDGAHGKHQPLLSPMENLISTDSIDRNVDYQGWLDAKKRKWKDTRERKKRRRLGAMDGSSQFVAMAGNHESMTSNKHNIAKNGAVSFFRRQELLLVHNHWQVQHSITVPRIFYLNSKAPITEEFPGRHVNKILPRGKPNFNLIEVVIEEEQFRAESRKLAALLADPEVEGIYEAKVRLDFNAVIQLGCVCRVDRNARHRNAQDGWNLSELHMKTTVECSYMELAFPFCYLYNSLSDGRGIYAVYFPASAIITVLVVNPFLNKELSSSILDRQFREASQVLSLNSGTPKNQITFKVEYVRTTENAEKHLQRILIDYRAVGQISHPGPVMCVIESVDYRILKSNIHALDEFPCIKIPFNARDSNYQTLGWQIAAGKTSMLRCAASSQWLNERILLSRYAHVPVGNFEPDWLLFTADVFFSRALRDKQQILWISDDGVPDLGGIVEEDTSFIDEVDNPFVTYSGAYRRVTVELKIHHLAVNALLKSSQIDEIEGGAMSGFDPDNNSSFDELSSCASAFRVLKQLIQRCIADAVASGNVFADAVLQHLYRWICSPLSKLHDPAIHRVLHKLMKKVFALLLSELRKLGATIVFANFFKIIVDTGKTDLPAARAYCDCLLKALQARDLLEWIELEPLQFWHSLLFLDQYNYGGILDKSTARSSADSESVESEPRVDIASSWNIAERLPKETQDHFILVVSEFLYIPWKYSLELAAARAGVRDDDDSSTPITLISAEALELRVAEYLKEQISRYFTEKLLRIVNDILLHFKRSRTDGGNAGGPAQFIKHVCAVLALDQHVEHDILVGSRSPSSSIPKHESHFFVNHRV